MVIEYFQGLRRTHYSNMISPDLNGKEVTVFGWVEDIRDLGKIVFLTLRDKEGLLQITVHRKDVEEHVLKGIDHLGKQYVIGVKGLVKANEEAPKGFEIIPSRIEILGVAKHPLPLDPRGRIPADMKVRFDARILDLRRTICRAIFKIRHIVLKEIRSFLYDKGYLEVNTPKIIATATEGGATLFPVEYFGKKAFLAQSPQLYKEQLISVFEKVFEVGTYFRAEEFHTRRHLNEYTSIDIEEAFVTQEDIMDTLEQMIKFVLERVCTECKEELKILKREIIIPKVPFKRISYDEIIKTLKKHKVPVEWGEDIPTQGEKKIGELYKGEFFFIVNWPTAIKPFYIMPKKESENYCYAFDLMYEGLELASGGTRIHDHDLLVKRLKEQELNPENFAYHLNTFKWGMPPHAGAGLGLERLLMVISGAKNIRECVLFPRDKERLYP
ncbi:MAG: aspartate--tRNA(Asn) ligase [Candidatus Bathyarchaeia archaeon]